NADKRSDIYSAGVVLFELLTGKKPYYGETEIETAWMHVQRSVPAPSSVVEDSTIPDYLDQLVLACTSRDPSERPADGHELLRRVRIARRALTAGITDDAELTHAMNPMGMQDNVANAASVSVISPPSSPAAVTGSESLSTPDSVNEETPQLLVGADARRTKAKRVGAMRLPAFNNEKRYRKRRGVVGFISVLLLALVFGFGTWWFAAGRYTDMPDLRNQTRDDANLLAAQAGITLKIADSYSEDVPIGLVITTDPAANTKIRRGGEAKTFLSIGPERYPVPNLVGSTLEEAKATLQSVNLELGTVTDGWSDDQPLGVIIDQSVALGEQVRRNTSIGVTVSRGRKPISVVDYTGQSAASALSDLNAAGLEVEIIDTYSDTAPSGTVLKQEPSSGELFKGETVKLTVSKGPEQVAIPAGLEWSRLSDAQAILEASDLKYEVRQSISYIGLNIVTETSPQYGTMVPRGYSVILYIK
ncbi:MAG: PASTA domain-containing protein, partial [Propionibacteriaceae bacterium]|nr:PASTA domain-containing protein [Propionibacteriaceae bacterium]